MKRKYNIVACPRWELPIKQLNIEAGVKFCERELADMSDGKFPLPLLDVDNVISNIRLDILAYLFFIKPEYESFFQLVKDVMNKKQNIGEILRDVFGELCDLAKKRILVIEKEVRGMYEEFKFDNGEFVNRKFDENYRLSNQHILYRYEHSLANFVKTGYLHQYEYIEDKYPEAIRVEEENGEEIEVMDLLFFYDRKKLDEDAIRQRINFFASETKCEVRVIVIEFDDVSQQEEIR
jgi:hypothetical protein